MPNKSLRLICGLLIASACLAFAAPSSAISFTVHGWDLGEQIDLTNGTTVWTAELDVTLEGGAEHTATFCVDLDSFIHADVYDVRGVLNAYTSDSPANEALRDFAWAGHVMDNYGYDVALLTGVGITRAQAITGVQAAIWEGLYGGGIVNISSLSDGARSIYEMILRSEVGELGTSLVIDLDGYQDQIIGDAGAPVPEPSAALVFGAGTLIAGSAARRRSR